MAKLSDIAARAGVGVSTVSYVLNKTGLHKVSAQTQERILAAARELNYVPNVAGRALRKGITYTVAVLFPEINGSFAFNILSGLENEFHQENYSMLFFRYRNREEFIDKCRQLAGRQIDGVIMLGVYYDALDEITELNKHHPVTALGFKSQDPDIPSVYVDGMKLNFLAVKHLISNGHRKIAVQGGADKNKKLGAAKAAADGKAELFFAPPDIRSGSKFLEWGLAEDKDITAFVAYSDIAAIELIGAALDQNLRIPEDISVIGADGEEFGSLVRPALTTIRQPDFVQGESAARVLLKKIAEGSAEDVVLMPELLKRDSVASLNQG
jgi:DNA-binding LacI/PurR family transcriptional regulator